MLSSSFVLGQPKEGIAGRNSSSGAIYYCSINFRDIANGLQALSTSADVTTQATTVNGPGSTNTTAAFDAAGTAGI